MRERKDQHCAARVGFTQAELLVVIGMIALLAAVLLPSVEDARRSAKPAASQRQANVSASTANSSPQAAPRDQDPPNAKSPSLGVTAERTEKRVGPATADDGAAGPAPIVIAGLGCAGETCEFPMSVPLLPFSTSGNTCLCIDNFDIDCPFEDISSGGDVVFRYVPSADECVDITLCGGGTVFDSKILLYRNACNAILDCNDDFCGLPPDELQSQLTNVSLTAGNTYYVVVDGYEGDCGDYQLDIGPCSGPCVVTCDPGKTAENEPNCGLPNDTVNGGCNSAPPVFTPIACGDTFCGTSEYNGNNRDTDWYKVVLDVPTFVTWTVTAEFQVNPGIIETGGVDTCPGEPAFRDSTLLEPCTTGDVTDLLPAGTWYLFIAPQFTEVETCGAVYNAALTCVYPLEACCLPGGGCQDATLVECRQVGGVSRGTGTRCQSDRNGDGIDEACIDPPCAQCGPGDHWIDQTPCPVGDPNVGGVCKFGGVNCLTDSDCTGRCRLNPGQNCLTRDDCTGRCEANPGQNCLENSDCGGVCTVSGVNCATDADCTAAGDVCAGNVCLGRECDNRICNKPNAMGQDTVPSGAVLGIDIDLDCVADVNVVSFGPATIGKKGPVDDATHFPGTRPIDGHKDVVDTEILSMSLTGGGFILTAGGGLGNQALLPSYGAAAEQPGDPALADSFFDVFVELDRGAGFYLYNQSPVRVQDVIPCMPPNANYFHITDCLPLYTSPVPGQGSHVANLTSANHFTYPGCCFGTQCVEPAPSFCEAKGGTLVPDCLGDGNGNTIDDACEFECDPDSTSLTRCTAGCPIDPAAEKCLPSKSGCDPENPGSCGVLACDCVNPDACRLQFHADGRPFCEGACPVPPGDECTMLGDGSFDDPYRCDCAPPPVCEADPATGACRPNTCPAPEECIATCAEVTQVGGATTVTATDCHCDDPRTCHLEVGASGAVTAGGGGPCEVVDNGSGSVDLPPTGCDYLSPDDVHKIIDGLPPDTEIHLAPIHKDFICHKGQQGGVCSFPLGVDCREDGGDLGGEMECSDSTLEFQLTGTGDLAGWNRIVTIPNVSFETHTGKKKPFEPVQSFPTEMFRLFGQITNPGSGDPDFDLLRITAGNDFALPSPGHTTLTQLPNGNWAVDSFFDITYRIDFVGNPDSLRLGGRSGSTTGTIRMATNAPFKCTNTCPPGQACVQTTSQSLPPDGTMTVCCDCVPTEACCLSDEQCRDALHDECIKAGGRPQGLGTTCANFVCVQPTVVKWESVVTHTRTGVTPIDVPLEITEDGLFSEPRGGVRRIVVTFDLPIDPSTATPDNVNVCGLKPGAEPGTYVPVDLSGIVMTVKTSDGDTKLEINFNPRLPDFARYLMVLKGIWGPTGPLKPGDGGLSRTLWALQGDTTGDDRVNATDVGGIRSLVPRDPINPAIVIEVRADINNDKRINATDVSGARSLVTNPARDARNIPIPICP